MESVALVRQIIVQILLKFFLNIYSINLHIVLQFTDAALKTNTWTHIEKRYFQVFFDQIIKELQKIAIWLSSKLSWDKIIMQSIIIILV